jgi:predicted amidohydrolase
MPLTARRGSGMAGGAFAAGLAAVFTITTFAAAPATAAPLRVFAIGHRIRMADVGSYQQYRDKMFAMVDAAVPNRSTLVQAGVDDVASHVQPADPLAPDLVLVNFPEDTALAAAFIGSRGIAARNAVASTQAFLSLFAQYSKPRNFYTQLYQIDPGAIVPQIVISVTDTTYRAFYETFRDIAMTYGIYVTVGANVPPARVIYEADDPVTYDKIIDPDEDGIRPYAYFATSAIVVNTTFLFMPDGEIFIQNDDGTLTSAPTGTGGELRGSQDKIYLTDVELGLLKLYDAPIDTMRVLDSPVGRLGVVISKDAWMPDINDRLAARHAHVMIQSEAFSEWAYEPTPWQPDIFVQGGMNNLQKHQSFQYNVDPSMTGNLLEITFDGQSAILGRQQKTSPGPLDGTNAWIGQNPQSGFLAVAPWIVDDPGIASPAMTLADRRTALAAEGAKLLPSSSVTCPTPLAFGACKNGYRESVVWTDVDVPDGVDVLRAPDATPPVATAWGTSVEVNADDDGAPATQAHVQLASDGFHRLYAVWQDTRHGNDNVYMAMSEDFGETWGGDVKVSDDAPGAFVEMLPDIAVHYDRHILPADAFIDVVTVYVVWQRLGAGGNQRDAQIRIAQFDPVLTKLHPDVRVDDADGVGKWQPTVATFTKLGHPVVTWVDERDTGPGVSRFEHLRAVRASGGRGPDYRPTLDFHRASRRLVRKKVIDGRSAQLDNEWAPTVAFDGRHMHAAWLDFRNYNWDVYAARGNRAGMRYKPGVRVDDSPNFERLNSSPSLAFDDETRRLVLAWSDQRDREPDTNIFYTTSTDGGVTWSAPARLDDGDDSFDPDTGVRSRQWQPDVTARGGRACVAWQDDRLGNSDIFAALSTDGGATFAADERVDDSSTGPSEQFEPATVLMPGLGRCYVAWSDDRSGDFDIRIASRPY